MNTKKKRKHRIRPKMIRRLARGIRHMARQPHLFLARQHAREAMRYTLAEGDVNLGIRNYPYTRSAMLTGKSAYLTMLSFATGGACLASPDITRKTIFFGATVACMAGGHHLSRFATNYRNAVGGFPINIGTLKKPIAAAVGAVRYAVRETDQFIMAEQQHQQMEAHMMAEQVKPIVKPEARIVFFDDEQPVGGIYANLSDLLPRTAATSELLDMIGGFQQEYVERAQIERAADAERIMPHMPRAGDHDDLARVMDRIGMKKEYLDYTDKLFNLRREKLKPGPGMAFPGGAFVIRM